MHIKKCKTSTKSKVAKVAVGMRKGPTYYGVNGFVTVFNISVNDQQFSSGNLWVQNGPSDHPNQMNIIAAGWAGNSSGCFNIQCPGFVSTNPEIGPYYTLGPPASTYGGRQYGTMFTIFQDRKTKNWWLLVFTNPPTYIGYWPNELLPKLSNGANLVGWGGTAIADKDGNGPPMGSGHLPDNNYKHSCYFKQIKFMNDQNQLQTPANNATYQYADCPGCYDDKETRNWSLISDGDRAVGYWPKELFNVLEVGVAQVQFGGGMEWKEIGRIVEVQQMWVFNPTVEIWQKKKKNPTVELMQSSKANIWVQGLWALQIGWAVYKNHFIFFLLDTDLINLMKHDIDVAVGYWPKEIFTWLWEVVIKFGGPG
ncbi:hypothetical protein COLO4_17046 [Corchorus olitorius]|uniref:Neprosin PEP catalytic domain-containing protein n=1 Tax=Corchorus olitorius TaxID=93759 RepID=A0A1R3JEG9_9ROSI|nr:hypothetical protein COLO4_17046 [Corchorus olitorius]